MGGATWIRAKERARKSIRRVATDLMKLYAERHQANGHAFPEDGPWQRELEESFPFEPTPDQTKATLEVKRDMEKARPMDRLVCGDVGFGKTEVAIRAIFKAITAGRQVAMLAPTHFLNCGHQQLEPLPATMHAPAMHQAALPCSALAQENAIRPAPF